MVTSYSRLPTHSGSSINIPKLRRPQQLALLLIICIPLYLLTHRNSTPPALSSSAFCPTASPHSPHIPTVILQGDGLAARDDNRTYWIEGELGASFLPKSWPLHELRFAQRPMEISSSWNEEFELSEALAKKAGAAKEEGVIECPIHKVPSSARPVAPREWRQNQVMFGMSTMPDRVLFNLPVWSHWLPAHPAGIEPTKAIIRELPLVLILIRPPNPTEEARALEAVEEAQTLGMHIQIRSLEADRFEKRYLGLVEEMWAEALKREESEGVRTEWFVFADDDTFFPDYTSLVRLLASYDSAQDVIIGALSETYKQVEIYGHMAYGGAGIFVSRTLMAKMNGPGHYESCVARFGTAFGGDAMTTLCAAAALLPDATTDELLTGGVASILTLDETLHQLDIRGDATGWFQSGFLVTSLHHWASWFTLFPPWHDMGDTRKTDVRKTIKTIGQASKLFGGDNFGRRYIFEEGKVVVSLGYSVVLYAIPLTQEQLDQTEHTWFQLETYHPLRDPQEESLDKRTYYLTSVVDVAPGVVRLEHTNREGERADVVWDGRNEAMGAWSVQKGKMAEWRGLPGTKSSRDGN